MSDAPQHLRMDSNMDVDNVERMKVGYYRLGYDWYALDSDMDYFDTDDALECLSPPSLTKCERPAAAEYTEAYFILPTGLLDDPLIEEPLHLLPRGLLDEDMVPALEEAYQKPAYWVPSTPQRFQPMPGGWLLPSDVAMLMATLAALEGAEQEANLPARLSAANLVCCWLH